MPSYKNHHFEDFEVGDVFETDGRTITQSMIDQYAMVSGDWAQHHVNKEYAKETMFGKRIAHGFLVYSVGTGLLYQTGAFNRTMVAVTEVTVKFPNPTYSGDTISASFEIVEKDEEKSPIPGTGVVKIEGEIVNDSGATVCQTEAGFIVVKEDEHHENHNVDN